MATTQSDNNFRQLPPGTKLLDHQVAGHLVNQKNNVIPFLQTKDKTLLKLIQLPPRGRRELNFYQTVFDEKAESDPILRRLKDFLPYFYGTCKFDIFPDELYLHLEDMTVEFEKASIADIKIGSQTYDPEASAEKIQYEKIKNQFSTEVGFKMGFRVYRPSTDTFHFPCRKKLLQLDQFRILEEGIGEYFNLSESLRKDAVFAILLELIDIKNWFENQRKFAFYSSSLLCIYEGLWPCKQHLAAVSQLPPSNHSIVNKNNGDCRAMTNIEDLLQSSYGKRDSCVKVKMIDFSHVYATCERDNNYLIGLDSLINYLKRLLTEL
ncbi:inositol polyphosphate multikinase-like [Octopus vulgaris]|uniref:Inositol polyphosphate multikinase-like n=2 Tax=Octopus TaxID=6643 RepID=A0AA36F8V7_OCTVU|nr:inositol polyphosphate multikinase-like [Octopus sinensis]XP_029638736.1 inositol polyphosphate multikinase-like [Octopus sinensis]XP_029638737.1 inositol polyphosphate multikinase-like [Octopus sinensis]XP_036360949.1 inositol polyphosphate multikinase-like [Octopus sinensis]CAI9726308.1 inositol polyphosphate multikinase-like [Octopus vulgaris]